MTSQNGNGKGNGAATLPKDNGKAVSTTAVSIPKKDEAKPEEKKIPEPSMEGKKVPELLPVEDRILKVSQLADLCEKRETLLETRQKLNSFKLSTDGNRDTLKISDSRGKEFITSNSGVIADVVEVMKKTIDSKLAEVENLIRF
jgi:hypothetical protein